MTRITDGVFDIVGGACGHRWYHESAPSQVGKDLPCPKCAKEEPPQEKPARRPSLEEVEAERDALQLKLRVLENIIEEVAGRMEGVSRRISAVKAQSAKTEAERDRLKALLVEITVVCHRCKGTLQDPSIEGHECALCGGAGFEFMDEPPDHIAEAIQKITLEEAILGISRVAKSAEEEAPNGSQN